MGKGQWISLFLYSCLLLLTFKVPVASGLAVDEKLSLRILSVSDSKKTVLINRGIEDGLTAGDHAKFFLTTGVIARGVLIKIAPSRSVWSIYRLVTQKELEVQKVMNLKITPAVQLTADPTKEMLAEAVLDKAPDGIALAEGANDLPEDKIDKLNKKDKTELIQFKKDDSDEELYLSHKTWEVFAMLHLNSLTTVNSTGTEHQGTTGGSSALDLLTGIEKYFLNTESWYGKLSFNVFFHYFKQETTSIAGNTASNSVFGYGLGTSYHFFTPPLAVEKFIPFANFSVGGGSASDEFKNNGEEGENVEELQNKNFSLAKGKVTFFSLGGGLKYTTRMGIGLKFLLDYYQRNESYTVEDSEDNYTKLVKGPRVLLGIAYRF